MIKYGTNNIGKIYFGSNPIGKAYLGSNLVFSRGSGPSPQPTTNVAYIRGGANGSYIDTGITADSTTRVIVWARNWQPYSEALFGSRTGMGSNEFAIAAVSGTQVDMIRLRFGTYTEFAYDAISNLYSNYHKYEINANQFLVDDVVKAQTNSATFSNSANIHLFGINTGGTHSAMNYPADICACQIYKGGTKVRDFTAVNSPSVGLYDSVSGTLFTNAGSGSFTYGTFNSSAYTPLEYIACDGRQFFDTGIYGSQNTKIVTKFRPNGATKTYYRLFGTRNSSDGTLMLELMIGNDSELNRYFDVRYKSSYTRIYDSAPQTNNDLVYAHNGNVFTLYKNNSQLGTSSVTASTFTTSNTIYVGSSNIGGSGNEYSFYGYIYYFGFGSDKNFVPAKVNNIAGMYDTYNDVFYPSDSGTNFVAGPSLERKYFFRNRKVAIIGDSISTYDQTGYKYDSYAMYYPAHDVTSVGQTWWKMLIDDDGATLGVNLSYSGSRASTNGTMPTLYDRIGLIGDADTVIIALGTNDSNGSVALGNYAYDTATSSLSVSTFREAYIKGIRGLLEANPSITIVCGILYMNPDYRNSIIEIANHYGLKYYDCGNSYDLTNQVHPTARGMQQIENVFLK